jgi:hypothetical protein
MIILKPQLPFFTKISLQKNVRVRSHNQPNNRRPNTALEVSSSSLGYSRGLRKSGPKTLYLVLSKHLKEAKKLHGRRSSLCITRRGYRAAANGNRFPQCCAILVSEGHVVVLENAGTEEGRLVAV